MTVFAIAATLKVRRGASPASLRACVPLSVLHSQGSIDVGRDLREGAFSVASVYRNDFSIAADDNHVREAVDTIGFLAVMVRIPSVKDVQVGENAYCLSEDLTFLGVHRDHLKVVFAHFGLDVVEDW